MISHCKSIPLFWKTFFRTSSPSDSRSAALVALWGDDLPIQRCTVHKHRNLLAHAPNHMHEELSNDYR